jgi:hypothetical protein
MNDNEIVLNLLEFYKKKGIDLYRVLDDPTFKSLSRETQLRAIQMYANKILHGTPSGFGKNDFKSVLKSMFLQAGLGALSGGLAGAGVAKTFVHGKVPPEAFLGGAIFGATTGLINAGINSVSTISDRNFVRHELNEVSAKPTPSNALNVLTANNIRGIKQQGLKGILDRIRSDTDKNMEDQRHTFITSATEQYNSELGNKKA